MGVADAPSTSAEAAMVLTRRRKLWRLSDDPFDYAQGRIKLPILLCEAALRCEERVWKDDGANAPQLYIDN